MTKPDAAPKLPRKLKKRLHGTRRRPHALNAKGQRCYGWRQYPPLGWGIACAELDALSVGRSAITLRSGLWAQGRVAKPSIPTGPKNPWGIYMPENPETEAELLQAELAEAGAWHTLDSIEELLATPLGTASPETKRP